MPGTEPFDNYSEEYDEWFTENADLYEAELEAIRRLIPSNGSFGMEAGIGSGKFALPLGIRIGVEPSEAMAVRARTRGITAIPGTAEELPFSDCIFDHVLMVTTICYVDDVTRSLEEAFRVLKKGGSVVVGFVDRTSELGRHYSTMKEYSRFYKDASFFSAQEVLGYLEGSGFVISNILQTLIPGEATSTILESFGRGSFVAIKGMKPADSSDSAEAE